jgi:hypothetical protein
MLTEFDCEQKMCGRHEKRTGLKTGHHKRKNERDSVVAFALIERGMR